MTIKTKPATNEYRENFDRIFTRNKPVKDKRKLYNELIDLKIKLADYTIDTGNFPKGSEVIVGQIMFYIDALNE